MPKTIINPKMLYYARPVFLAGTVVDGKPNFITIAGGGSMAAEPLTFGIPLDHSRYSLRGIRENGCFSINVPAAAQVREVDYCGLVSGADVDKALVCGFDVFYGELEGAPLIEQCPVNIALRVDRILEIGIHAFVMGIVVETFGTEACLVDGKLVMENVDQLMYSLQNRQYWSLGKPVADGFSIGRELKEGSAG